MSRIDEIFFDYNKAIEAADYLDSLADEMMSTTEEDYNGAIGVMKSEWTGDNAEDFYSKADAHTQKMEAAANNLRTIAEAIRTIAKRWFDTEMANIGISC